MRQRGGGVRPEVTQDAAFKNLVEPLPQCLVLPACGWLDGLEGLWAQADSSRAGKGLGPAWAAGAWESRAPGPGPLCACLVPSWAEPPLLSVHHSGCIPGHRAASGSPRTHWQCVMCPCWGHCFGGPAAGFRLTLWLLAGQELRRGLTASSDWWAAAQKGLVGLCELCV